MINKQIKKAYDINKKVFHANPLNRGRQLAHIFEGADKATVLRACLYNFASLTAVQHLNWEVLKSLKEQNYELRRKILDQYVKGEGCTDRIGIKCDKCPMLRRKNEKMGY